MGLEMPIDDHLNPASTVSDKQIADLERKIDDLKAEYLLFFNGELRQPPEKKRTDLEHAIRQLIYSGAKTARIDMIIQNLASRFSLYNNFWLKKLNEAEFGAPLHHKKHPPQPPAAPKKEKGPQEILLNLNDEESFERLAEAYQALWPASGKTANDKENIIDSMKAKMLTHNLVEAKVSLSMKDGKLSIKIKK
jgi:hypothetical protein